MSPSQTDVVAAAIANARGGRRGMPPIKNILSVLPQNLVDEVRDDAEAVLRELILNQSVSPSAAEPGLLDALVGLVGLVELIIPTLEGSQKSAVQHNHRLTDACRAIAKATGGVS